MTCAPSGEIGSAGPGSEPSPVEGPNAWLASLDPPPPEPLRLRLLRAVEGCEKITVDELADLGAGALRRALGEDALQRTAAYDLLTADALITYACEAATREDEVEEALEAVLSRVGEGFEG